MWWKRNRFKDYRIRAAYNNDMNQVRFEVVKNVTKLYKYQPTWRGVAFSGSPPGLELVTKPSQEPQATPRARCSAVNVRVADDTSGIKFVTFSYGCLVPGSGSESPVSGSPLTIGERPDFRVKIGQEYHDIMRMPRMHAPKRARQTNLGISPPKSRLATLEADGAVL